MDTRLHEVSQGGIDHPLPLHAVLADELRALDAKAEVALARGIVTAVTTMLLAFVDELDPGWSKRRIEALKHFSRDWTGSLGIH